MSEQSPTEAQRKKEESRQKDNQRVIFHADMDSFFASVEMLHRPSLRGKAVIVGGSPGSRSVVSSPSYEARKSGVRSGMALGEAQRLCPHGIFLPGNARKYVWYSNLVHRILIEFSSEVEIFSIDEAFIQFPFQWERLDRIEEKGKEIRNEVRQRLGLAITIGVAHNKLLAKLTSKDAKPDGLKILPPERVDEFLLSLPVEKLWGVGERTRADLHRLGVYRVHHLRRIPGERLIRCFGKWGEALNTMAWGQDDTPLHPYYKEYEEKSLGHEETFARDLTDPAKILAHLMELCEKVAARLRKKRRLAQLITVKKKDPAFKTRSRCSPLAWPTNLDSDLYQAARQAMSRFDDNGQPVRLLGVSAGNLIDKEESSESNLLDPLLEKDRRRTNTVDVLRRKYGPSTIFRGRTGGVLKAFRGNLVEVE